MVERHALILDKFHLTDLEKGLSWHLSDRFASSTNADLQFLQERGIVLWLPHKSVQMKPTPEMETQMKHFRSLVEGAVSDVYAGVEDPTKLIAALDVINDVILRGISARLNDSGNIDTVPICKTELPRLASSAQPKGAETVLRVALESLPAPDDSCAWQDIIDFRTDGRDKLWSFRRFLHDLATKPQTEAEISDDIEWTMNEYATAMKLHNLKAAHSFVDVFLISPLEIIENLAKLNWSKIAKGILSVKQRKVELMEAEHKAPGKECAYVFDARQRFGRNQG
jgi:hypothetical protein